MGYATQHESMIKSIIFINNNPFAKKQIKRVCNEETHCDYFVYNF
jgi:hypothetical protein